MMRKGEKTLVFLLLAALLLASGFVAAGEPGGQGGGRRRIVPRIEWKDGQKKEDGEQDGDEKEEEPEEEEEPPEVIVKTNERRYRFLVEASFKTKDIWKENYGVVLYFPYPETNAFQEVEYVGKVPGKVETLPGFGEDKFIRVYYSPERIASLMGKDGDGGEQAMERRSAPGEITVRHEFVATLYDVQTDWESLTDLYPYDTESELYQVYTASEALYIELENPDIQDMVSQLREASENDLEFIQLAFRYVKDTIMKHDGRPTMLPLSRILSKGGQVNGVNAVFVSLLRGGGIPARLVNARRADKKIRFWSEFYLEKYGWIPADPTMNVSNDRFFGTVIIPRKESRSTRVEPQMLIVNHLYGQYRLPVPQGPDMETDSLLDCKFWGLYSPPRYQLTVTNLGGGGKGSDKKNDDLAPLRKLDFKLR